MSDLIKVRRDNGKVIAERIINNMDPGELLDYARREYRLTMKYAQYGFEKPILGIGCGKGCALPIDNSDAFYGYSKDGLIMICPHLEDIDEYAEDKDLYLQYDDEEDGWTDEIITFISR